MFNILITRTYVLRDKNCSIILHLFSTNVQYNKYNYYLFIYSSMVSGHKIVGKRLKKVRKFEKNLKMINDWLARNM